jgi:AMP deaminase
MTNPHDINLTELSSAQAERSRETLEQLIPNEQALYDIGHAVALPKSHFEIGVDDDMIPMVTRFDRQAAMGQFSTDELNDFDDDNNINIGQLEEFSLEIRGFCKGLHELMLKREKYLTVSKQRAIDNPLNWDDWISYPPPQPKGWHYEDEYGAMDYYYDEQAIPHYFGENFHIEDYVSNILDRYLQKNPSGGQLLRDQSGSWCVQGYEPSKDVPDFQEFVQDLHQIIDLSSEKIGQQLSLRRLDYLRNKFESYGLLNEHRETYLTTINPHRDFYNVRKIDNNVDLTMSMSKKHLLNVINKKLNEEPDRVVYEENGIQMTLQELFEPYFEDDRDKRLNIDDLFEFGLIDHTLSSADLNDRNLDYEDIIKRDILLRIDKTFLRIDNYIEGEYLSLVLKQVLSDFEKSKYQFAETGINLHLMSEYQKMENGWSSIASWIVDNKLVSHNVKWVMRIARNYPNLLRAGVVNNFQDFLDLIFKPLFDVSIDPESDFNLHFFLTKTSAVSLLPESLAIDIIMDFSKLPSPSEWATDTNPPYGYYLYYLFKNLTNLNSFRASKNQTLLTLRPSVASLTETHATESLATSFLFGHTIINGERLIHHPVLQYLYYLKQIGISISPLCWNKSVQFLNDDGRMMGSSKVAYEMNPSIDFFKCGMHVALSTDKPLFSSLTREPLIEEYSVAGSIHKLSNIDLCELCRNSVLISGFNAKFKSHWIGIKYVEGDREWVKRDEFAIQRSNVPDMRLDYRMDCVNVEIEFVMSVGLVK